MRILIAAPLLGAAALALAACSPAAEEPVAATPADDIQSTTAPSVGGPVALPTDEGVTPAPEAMEDASAEDVSAAVSPEQAAALAGGAEPNPAERPD